MLCRFAIGKEISTRTCSDGSDSVRVAPGFGDGTSRRAGSTYWSGTLGDRLDFVSGLNTRDPAELAYVRPVRTWSQTPPTTTTTLPKTCAEGGSCAIGDISPNGGLIVDMSAVDYTEIAPKVWSPENTTTDPMMLKEIATTAASNYKSPNGLTGWRLPTDREMRAAFLYFALPVFNADCTAARGGRARTVTQQLSPYTFGGIAYWIGERYRPAKFDNFNFSDGAAYYDVSNMRFSVRPFRTTPYNGGQSAVGAQWNPDKCRTAVIPTTTTTTQFVGCAGRGKCSIGDTGPNGGVIIFVSNVAGEITYTEMRRNSSTSQDCFGKSAGNSCTQGTYDEYMRTFGLNGTFDNYPTANELRVVATNGTLRSRLNMRNNSPYWTNRFVQGRSLSADVNGNLNDLGRSLQLNPVVRGQTVTMGSGAVNEIFEYAFFRGVNRWKCQYSCK